MTRQKFAIGLVAVALFVGSMTAHAAELGEGYKAIQRGDYATAIQIFRQFAEQGDTDAQNNLGFMYNQGWGVTQDYIQALLWYNLAEAQVQKDAGKFRDLLVKQMAPEQIAKAQKLAREWKPKRK